MHIPLGGFARVGEEVPPSYRLVSTTPNGVRAFKVWRLLPGTGKKCLVPFQGLGHHYPQWETLLICPPKPQWLCTAELAPSEGRAGCTQPECTAHSSWES